VARQVLRLAEYDIELRHIPGKTNGRADALSRLPNYNQGEDNNKDVTVLPDHLFVRLCYVHHRHLPDLGDVGMCGFFYKLQQLMTEGCE
jgi:hypothetical protein